MAASSGFMIAAAERRFPVRIRIGVPPDGLGSRLDRIKAWLDENCGANGWAIEDSNFFLGLQIMSLMLNLLRRNQELPIGLRRTAHGVRCNVAPVRGVGSSSRTWKTPPAVSTLYPAHHRATALTRVGSPK